jgi:hypothetical protein
MRRKTIALVSVPLLFLACGGTGPQAHKGDGAASLIGGDGLVTSQSADMYCWASYRANGASGPPYSYVAGQQVGGVVPSGGASTMIATCKNRVKADTTWLNNVCHGLSGNWTVNTDVLVAACSSVIIGHDPCGNWIGSSGFWANCSNGVVVATGP